MNNADPLFLRHHIMDFSSHHPHHPVLDGVGLPDCRYGRWVSIHLVHCGPALGCTERSATMHKVICKLKMWLIDSLCRLVEKHCYISGYDLVA